MKIRYKSVTSKMPIVVELPDDIKNADEIKKAVLTFRVKNIVEARRRDQAIEMAKEGEIPTETTGDFASFLERDERNEVLYKAIRRLPIKQQDLIDKRFFQGMTITEIALEEGVKKQSIHERLKRALKNLKKILVAEIDK